jgi:tetratricopeptide (TPR) repeat protein
LDDYDKAIFLDDMNPFFYVLKAGIYEKLAFENFDKALSIDPACHDAYINRALVDRHHKKYADAQKDYEKAMSLQPKVFRITVFNEEDIFRYGQFDGMALGRLCINMYLSPYPHKQSKTDTCIFLEPYKFRRFYFKKRKATVSDKQFEQSILVLVAKGIFRIRTRILKQKVRFIDEMT